MTIEQVQKLAVSFLKVADNLNELVSDYISGSGDPKAYEAYKTVKKADKQFIDAVNAFYGSRDYEYGLNYDLAEYFIG